MLALAHPLTHEIVMRIETPGIAAITGGGSGFGKALCLELASHGWKIAIADIDTGCVSTDLCW